MIKITRTATDITADGHAAPIVCAMCTAITVGFMKNLTERLKQNVPFTLRDGYFHIETTDIYGDGVVLLDAYWYTIKELQKSYPDHIKIKERSGEQNAKE